MVFDQVFGLLNDPEKEHELIDASIRNLPAIAAIKDDIHNETNIVAPFNGLDGNQYRNTFGHVICKKMQRLGWQPCLTPKKPVPPYFKSCTIYEPTG